MSFTFAEASGATLERDGSDILAPEPVAEVEPDDANYHPLRAAVGGRRSGHVAAALNHLKVIEPHGADDVFLDDPAIEAAHGQHGANAFDGGPRTDRACADKSNRRFPAPWNPH